MLGWLVTDLVLFLGHQDYRQPGSGSKNNKNNITVFLSNSTLGK